MAGHSWSLRVRPWAPGAPPYLQGPGQVTVTTAADGLGAGEVEDKAVRGRVAWAREHEGLQPNQNYVAGFPVWWGKDYRADTWTPPGQRRVGRTPHLSFLAGCAAVLSLLLGSFLRSNPNFLGPTFHPHTHTYTPAPGTGIGKDLYFL